MYLATQVDNKKPIDVSRHGLPSVMYISDATTEAYIEYVLEAEIGSSKATAPLFVRARGSDTFITDFRLQSRTMLQLTKAPQLLAGNAHSELTLRQISSRLIRPSRTPTYTYFVRIEYPTTIQIGHPDPLPFKIAVIPDTDPERSTIFARGGLDTPPSVLLVGSGIGLKMRYDIRCPGILTDHEGCQVHELNIPFRIGIRPLLLPNIAASDIDQVMSAPEPNSRYTRDRLRALESAYGSAKASEPHEPADLGSHLRIHIDSSASSTLGQRPVRFERQLQPSFKTYNICLTYELHWKLVLDCVGETSTVHGSSPVRVLAPSEEQDTQ